MTVRHIVSWKMNGETAEDRERQLAEIEEALEGLPALVPGVLSFDLRRNDYNADANWDLVLVSEHVDKDALDAYAVHPDHLVAVAIVRERVAARACVDFEILNP